MSLVDGIENIEEIASPPEGQEEVSTEEQSEEIVQEGDGQEELKEETAEPTLADVIQLVQKNSEDLHKVRSSMGRVKKSLFEDGATGQLGKSQTLPQQQVAQVPQINQGLVQPQGQQQGLGTQQQNFSQTIVDSLGEEVARPLLTGMNQMIQQGIQQGLAPYAGVLDQVTQAVNMSTTSNQNISQLRAAFGDIATKDVAVVMRENNINEEEVRLFESNPGVFPPETVAPYFRAVFQSQIANPEKTAQLLNNATKKSNTVLKKGKTKVGLSAAKQTEGKSEVEISVMIAKNPKLGEQLLKEAGFKN